MTEYYLLEVDNDETAKRYFTHLNSASVYILRHKISSFKTVSITKIDVTHIMYKVIESWFAKDRKAQYLVKFYDSDHGGMRNIFTTSKIISGNYAEVTKIIEQTKNLWGGYYIVGGTALISEL